MVVLASGIQKLTNIGGQNAHFSSLQSQSSCLIVTIAVNLTAASVDLGMRVLLLHVHPGGNLTAFYLTEKELDALLGEFNEDRRCTILSQIKPAVYGKGPVKEIEARKLSSGKFLCPGGERIAGRTMNKGLPGASIGSFARKTRDYDVNVCPIAGGKVHGEKR